MFSKVGFVFSFDLQVDDVFVLILVGWVFFDNFLGFGVLWYEIEQGFVGMFN